MGPRIVAAETPDVTFQVAACVPAAAVVFILNVSQHHGAIEFGASAVRVAVGDDYVSALGLAASDFVRMLHQAAEVTTTDRRQHDHSVAESELGVGDSAVLIGHHEMLLE